MYARRSRLMWGLMLMALLTLALLTVAGCGSSTSTTTTAAPSSATTAATPESAATTTPTTAAAKNVKIGITVIVTHPVLALVEKSFKQRMTELGWAEGQNVLYETKNAEGDAASTTAIAQQFVDGKKDLVLGLGTPSIQAMAKATKTIPIVFSAMTDPVGAGVVQSMDKPGGNVTGVTDWVDPETQFALVLEAYPNTKKVGTILNLSEASSKAWMDAAAPAAKKLNLELINVPVAGTGDLQSAAQSLIGRVDVIFLPGDNTTAAGMEVLTKVAISNKMPLIANAVQTADQGALIAIGMDYTLQGTMAADLADKILKGANPGDLAVQTTPKLEVVVNTKTAQAIGAQLPTSIMSRAKTVDK
ncbi:MAG: ABC transporter substrate-binding protein [Actinobacteria bacterium]|nr:ABC transporter substrate-binding protein [Actinomycetota bacterium]